MGGHLHMISPDEHRVLYYNSDSAVPPEISALLMISLVSIFSIVIYGSV